MFPHLQDVIQGVNFINVMSFMREPLSVCLKSPRLSYQLGDGVVTSPVHFSLVGDMGDLVLDSLCNSKYQTANIFGKK